MTTMAFLPPIIASRRIARRSVGGPAPGCGCAVGSRAHARVAAVKLADEKCPLCGVTLAPRYEGIRDLVTDERFSVLSCGTCNLGVTAPRVTDLARYYGPQYWGGRHSFTAEYCARRRVKIVSRLGSWAPGGRVLDFGCGDGTFLRRASRAGWYRPASKLRSAPKTGERRLRSVQQPRCGPQPRPVRRDHHVARPRAPDRSARHRPRAGSLLAPGASSSSACRTPTGCRPGRSAPTGCTSTFRATSSISAECRSSGCCRCVALALRLVEPRDRDTTSWAGRRARWQRSACPGRSSTR